MHLPTGKASFGAALLLTTALGLGISVPASAQELEEPCANAPAGSQEALDCANAVNDLTRPQTGIGEIVVTARKRSENLQDIPDTVTAFSSDVIDELRLQRIDDFLALTSNVRITNDQDTGTNNIAIRGLGSNRNQAAAVAFSVDGVVLPDADAFTVDLSDVERVEILKGPQGALYGKGAIAGAINITTKRPTNYFAGEAKASYATGDAWRVFGAISGPIVEDLLLARVSLSHRDSDGTIINQFDGRGLDRNRQTRATGRLILTPTPELELDLRAAYTDELGGATWFGIYDVLGTTGGEITSDIASTQPNIDGPSLTERTIADVSLLANYEIPYGTLTSITAYNDIDIFFQQDLDLSPYPLVPLAEQSRVTESLSQEIRFTSPGDLPLRYIVGAYYQNTKRDVDTFAELDVCLFIASCFAGPGGSFSSFGVVPAPLTDNRITFNHYAAFGQVNYDITDALELTAALRYDVNDARMDDYMASLVVEETFSAIQPKLSLAYRTSEQLMVYGTYSQGFKSGSFNPASAGPAFPRVIEEENSRNFEVGFKSNWFDRRLIFNAAAFYTEHLNPQIFQLDAATFTQGSLNAERAEIKGFEMELNARPFEGFDVNAAFGYTDAKIEDFDGQTDVYVGQRLPNAPEFTLNLGAQYERPVTDTISGRVRVDYAAVGWQSFQDFQNPLNDEVYLYQPTYDTVDAQIGLEGVDWTATLFAKNLFDEDYATSAFSRYIFAVGLVPLGVDAVQPNPGRIVGVELGYKFR